MPCEELGSLGSSLLHFVTRFYKTLQARKVLLFPGLDVAGLTLGTNQDDAFRHLGNIKRLGAYVVFVILHIIQ